MGVFDGAIVLIALFGIYIGFQQGFIKQILDLVIISLCSYLASIISKPISDALYNILPFFNFTGKAQGLKSLNIILWRVLIYILIIIIVISIISKILKKTGLQAKITDAMVEANFISKIVGAIVSIPLMLVFIYDLLLVLMLPNINLTFVGRSNFANIILKSTPVLAKQNSSLYESELFALERINEEDNNIDEYSAVNDDIIECILENKLASSKKVEKMIAEEKLLGVKTKSKVEEPSGNDPGSSEPKTTTNNRDDDDDSDDDDDGIYFDPGYDDDDDDDLYDDDDDYDYDYDEDEEY